MLFRKSRRTKFWLRALFVICTRVTTLDSCYMKNALVFSQSEARYFFLVYNYIPNQLRSESLEFKYKTFCKLKYILCGKHN